MKPNDRSHSTADLPGTSDLGESERTTEPLGHRDPFPSRRARWLLLAAVIAIAIAGAWALLSRTGATATARGSSGETSGMVGMKGSDGGMDGMAGMTTSADGSVVLTSDQMRTFGVTFGSVEVRDLVSATRAAGSVMVDETRVVQVASRVGGFVERLYVNVTGQAVRRGQPLLELYSPELVAAQQELLVAADLQRSIGQSAVPGIPANTTDLVTAARRRFALWNISERQVDEVLRTGRTRRTMTLFAPASGVVTERKVMQGQSVMPGEMLYTIADFSRVWVEAELRGADASTIRVGTTAEIEITGLSGRVFTGRVEYVYPTVEAVARTIRARISVANAEGALKPGMYATVRLTTPSRAALTVPSTAVLRTGERTMVFVDMGGGSLMPHDVELGRVAGDYTEVLGGVEPGQRVVTSAQFLLDSESNLAEVMKSMIGMGGGMQGMSGMDMKGADMKGMDMPAGKSGTKVPAKASAPRTPR